ncbi:MAG: hypothetical protein M3285_04920 [Actinomycetota bacterium]|nr:hypothetical protein [Actinomycetota bacterium]
MDVRKRVAILVLILLSGCADSPEGRSGAAPEASPSGAVQAEPTPSETPIDLESHVIDDGVVSIRPKKVRPGDTMTLSIKDPPGDYGLDWYLYRKDGSSEWTYIGGFRAGPPGQWQKHRQNRFFFLPKWRNVGIPSIPFDGSDSIDLTVPALEAGTYGIFGLFYKKDARERHIDLFEVI